jgi:RNA polymerase sigma-70 factor (ECF subfamily)
VNPENSDRCPGPDGDVRHDVLGRARSGDERAFLALYRAAQPGLLRYLTVLVGEAAEVVSERTWAEVGRELAGFTGTLEGFRAWVAGIGRRRALELLAELGLEAVEVPGSSIDPGAGPTSPRTARALRMIAELPREQAEAITLRSVMGLDETAAATVLGIRRGTLRRHALRGLRALARRLDPLGSRPADLGSAAEEAAVVRNLQAVAGDQVAPAGGEDGGSDGQAPPAHVDLESRRGIEVSS